MSDTTKAIRQNARNFADITPSRTPLLLEVRLTQIVGLLLWAGHVKRVESIASKQSFNIIYVVINLM